MHKKFVIFFIFIVGSVAAQELNCTVKVNFEQVAGSNNQVFKTMETVLTDFVNKTSWTSLKVKNNERINCSMFININEYNTNQFKASIQVGSSRPIYNSMYSSPVFNYNDKDFNFEYTEFQLLNYNPNSFDSNLVSDLVKSMTWLFISSTFISILESSPFMYFISIFNKLQKYSILFFVSISLKKE